MNTPSVHWTLIGRYAVLVALTSLLPVPLLDGWLENLLRRRLVRSIASVHGFSLDPADVGLLANTKGSCLGCLVSLVLWPFKRILRTVFIVLQIKWMADLASDVAHRGALIDEAFDLGYLPGDAEAVRQAMDEALKEVSPRVLEGVVLPMFTRRRLAVLKLMRQTTTLTRKLVRLERAGKPLQAADEEPLEGEAGAIREALVTAIRESSTWPELEAAYHDQLRTTHDRPSAEVASPFQVKDADNSTEE